jgi:hypothetical protein
MLKINLSPTGSFGIFLGQLWPLCCTPYSLNAAGSEKTGFRITELLKPIKHKIYLTFLYNAPIKNSTFSPVWNHTRYFGICIEMAGMEIFDR